jgi:hypothetical protein
MQAMIHQWRYGDIVRNSALAGVVMPYWGETKEEKRGTLGYFISIYAHDTCRKKDHKNVPLRICPHLRHALECEENRKEISGSHDFVPGDKLGRGEGPVVYLTAYIPT